MKKRILFSLVLAFAILLGMGGCSDPSGPSVGPGETMAGERTFAPTAATVATRHTATPLSVGEAVSSGTPRDGYILAPTIVGLAGVDTISGFVLQTPAGYDTSMPTITIDGQPTPMVTREDDATFLVTPAAALTPNSVYTFRLRGDGDADITWAFQTAPHFGITGTLPRHQATHVPVRTGIEVAFSFGEHIDITEHFQIYPHVEGRFTHRDATTIFMPTDPLAEGQIYTVTITAGLGAPDTAETLATDYVFSFETEPAAGTGYERSGRVHFLDSVVEFPSFAAPSVHFWLNYDREQRRPVIDITVHRMDDRAQGVAAVNQLAGTPRWSLLVHDDHVVEVADLASVYTGTITDNVGASDWGNETFTLSNTLPPGFYVLTASADSSVSQVIIQITDLAVQMLADEERTILWVNDMTTGTPAAGASVYDPGNDTVYEVSEYGVAVVEGSFSFGEHLVITANDGKELLVFGDPFRSGSFDRGWGWDAQDANSYYWTALQLDRTLFQRNDTLSFWGFVQNRHQHETIPYVTAVLTEHTWWHDEELDTLERQNIPVENGAYSGGFRLPHLEPGSYELAVYHGDILLRATFFSVMDYETPPYRLGISANKNAIFAGEEVTFSVHTAFFEGTPVPDLEVSYDIWGWELTAEDRGQGQTDADGVLALTVTPYADRATVSGERSIHVSAEATLPEMGWTHAWSEVRVFVNDIHIRPQATRTGSDASLSVDMHAIDLDRINNETATGWDDFLGEPAAGHQISVEILELYWEPIRQGESYDHVTRQVVPRYRYEQRERLLEQFDMTTDADGNAVREFQVPDNERVSYQARLTATDGNGRTITQEVFIGRDFTWFHWNAEDQQLFLDGVNEDGYDVGDEVELTIMRGAEPVTQGNFLFVTVQNGILSYHIGQNPLTFTFGEVHVPNVQVFAFHFNGHTYQAGWQMSQRLQFAATDRNLEITITTDEEGYRPGDTVSLHITTTDTDGNPKAANVNISLVDEALFALMEYTKDTFAMLYEPVRDSLRVRVATHRTFASDGIDGLGGVYVGSAAPTAAPETWALATDDAEESALGGDGGDTRVRERFEDTATFISLRTDAAGAASVEIPLPDNITSWRVTASAISEDLYAGNTQQQVQVTQPMFLHYSLNRTFLVGDTPYIGINAYGSSLSGGEQVVFEVWREDDPTDIRRGEGVPFERVNLPLWEMTEEGFGTLIIQATVGAYRDAVQHTYQVVGSHRLVDTAVFYDVTPDTVFDVASGGLTSITFMDLGRGQFLNDLIRMRRVWDSGARIEGLVAKREATAHIRTYFPEVDLFGEAGNFHVADYQTENGGIAILPYAEADLQATVALIPFVQADVNLPALRGYLQEIADITTTENRMLALYGLALLGEPVLLELQRYAALPELSIRDAAYVALGLAAMGETYTARGLYDRSIAPHIQQVAPYYRVNTGGGDGDTVDTTSITALLAAQLGMPESMGLHNYAARNRPENPLMHLERLAFIIHEMAHHTDTTASITYTLFGETVTRELDHGGQFTLRIPTQRMGEFNLTAVNGEVGAVSILRTPLEDTASVEGGISIRREFFRAGTTEPVTSFAQGDLIRVQITVEYDTSAVSGAYVITDFLPAGLVHVANSARFGDRDSTTGWWAHAATEGQRITFFDYNSSRTHTNTYYFYARAINPGTFRAEGAMIQNLDARGVLVIGEDTMVVIEA